MTDTFTPLPRDAGRGVFGADAPGYHAARVGYPDALIAQVFAYAGGSAARILEIGPGTGLATRLLLHHDPEVLVAVEPDAGLVTYLADTIGDSRLRVLHGGFVETDLSDILFDLVAAACAFHWVEPGLGLAKVRHVLRPGGTVALWWHSYRNPGHDPFFDMLKPDLAGIALPPSEMAGGYAYLDERTQRAALAAAGFEDIEFAVYSTERLLDAEQMRALYASFSFVRLLPAERRMRLLDRIATLVDTRFDGTAPNVVLSPLYMARAPIDDRSVTGSSH